MLEAAVRTGLAAAGMASGALTGGTGDLAAWIACGSGLLAIIPVANRCADAVFHGSDGGSSDGAADA